MPQDKKLTKIRLDELWQSDEISALNTKGNKYVMFSDAHLGDGRKADDFHKNEETFETALEFYKKNDYKLILLGDIEEFWQFDLDHIVYRYNKSIYKKIRAFGDERVYRVLGNHDMDWRLLPDPSKNKAVKYEGVVEAIKMKDMNGNIRILIVHGHHGSTESDRNSWSSRFWVRNFKKIEPLVKWLGITRHPSATKSRIVKDYERILYSWAKQSRVILICGHSHRAIFSSKSYVERLKEMIAELQKEILANRKNKEIIEKNRKKIKKLNKKRLDEIRKKRTIDPTEQDGKPLPCYFNAGCALYNNGITCIELAEDEIRLVKWHRDTQKDPRFEVYERGKLSEYIDKVVKQ